MTCPGARIVKVNYRTILLASVACVSGCSGVARRSNANCGLPDGVDGPAGLHQQRQYNADGPRPSAPTQQSMASAAAQLATTPGVLEFQARTWTRTF